MLPNLFPRESQNRKIYYAEEMKLPISDFFTLKSCVHKQPVGLRWMCKNIAENLLFKFIVSLFKLLIRYCLILSSSRMPLACIKD